MRAAFAFAALLGLGAAGPADARPSVRSHHTAQRRHGACHAAVDEIIPAGLRSIFHRVVTRESSGNPSAVHRNRNGTIDRGCTQINSVHRQSAACLFDARCNIRYAYRLYRRDGVSPWNASSGGH